MWDKYYALGIMALSILLAFGMLLALKFIYTGAVSTELLTFMLTR